MPTTYAVLLRAVNVGGTGKLPMATLRALCEAAGFADVRTYIASGNVVLRSDRPEAEIKAAIEQRLADHAGKPVGVVVRSAGEMAAILAANPFPDAKPSHTVAIFLDAAPDPAALDAVRHRDDEIIALGRREIYVTYPGGQGHSKLVIPAAAQGTARNMNTIAKLVEMAGAD
ncbi:DUF1697 domain-containing protein [Pelagibacterium lacus]|uniref:DUF1697 domain-containing protein n=1 Tax=Pelagibacterium lacus TaxID=2282655 RepID=A0A369W9D8_9HYPH|nr:DUF1697 domain-containing protein [Pelagibacterium lacus]RDE10475.1 DUF1697 domain-containing protein [Pelagibacterium lacus]